MVQYQILTQSNELSDSVKANSEAEERTALDAFASASSPPSPLPSTSPSTSSSKASSASSSAHRDETAGHQEQAKRESKLLRNIAPKVDSEIDKKMVIDTNGAKSGHGEEQHNEGGHKMAKQMEAECKLRHRATQSVQDTVTITESHATEAQVRFLQ